MENSEGNHRFELGPEAAVLLPKAAVVAAANWRSWQRNTRNLLSHEKEM